MGNFNMEKRLKGRLLERRWKREESIKKEGQSDYVND